MTETKQYEHLKRWAMPNSYFGATWDGWYSSGVGRSRDSDALERANFDAMKKRLAALPDMEVMTPTRDSGFIEASAVQVVRESHWAVGWVEWIAIHETNTAALELANTIKGEMEDYPCIDEDLWGEYEDNDCESVWKNCYNDRERLEYLKKHVKREWLLNWKEIRAAVKGDWGYAANLLPCPSDLIA